MKLNALDLAAEFDGSFALAHREAPVTVDVLAIGVGGDRYALRISDIAGLFADRAITAVPSSRAELLGIAGFRGSIVPVFDLAVLLGYTSIAAPRWLVIASGTPVALAFEEFAGQLRVPREEQVLPVIDLASILNALVTST